MAECHLIVRKRDDAQTTGADRLYFTAQGAWVADRARAKGYATRAAALADHPKALKATRPAGYRTPVVVER